MLIFYPCRSCSFVIFEFCVLLCRLQASCQTRSCQRQLWHWCALHPRSCGSKSTRCPCPDQGFIHADFLLSFLRHYVFVTTILYRERIASKRVFALLSLCLSIASIIVDASPNVSVEIGYNDQLLECQVKTIISLAEIALCG